MTLSTSYNFGSPGTIVSSPFASFFASDFFLCGFNGLKWYLTRWPFLNIVFKCFLFSWLLFDNVDNKTSHPLKLCSPPSSTRSPTTHEYSILSSCKLAPKTWRFHVLTAGRTHIYVHCSSIFFPRKKYVNITRQETN